MNSSDTLLRATLNRLSARLGEKILNTAAEIAVIAKDAPDQIKKEWEVLKQEIYEEAERLKNDESNTKEEFNSDFQSGEGSDSEGIRDKVERIRKKVAALNQKVENRNL